MLYWVSVVSVPINTTFCICVLHDMFTTCFGLVAIIRYWKSDRAVKLIVNVQYLMIAKRPEHIQ
jgi:hypothetical protein